MLPQIGLIPQSEQINPVDGQIEPCSDDSDRKQYFSSYIIDLSLHLINVRQADGPDQLHVWHRALAQHPRRQQRVF
jgi:hypothetical protein